MLKPPGKPRPGVHNGRFPGISGGLGGFRGPGNGNTPRNLFQKHKWEAILMQIGVIKLNALEFSSKTEHL